MLKYIFIINPIAGKGRGKKLAPELESFLDINCSNYEILFTTKKNDAINLVKGLEANHKYCIVAVGGDGTVNEIVNGIGENSDHIFSVLPIGSGNDFARSVNLLGDWKIVLKYILSSDGLKTIDMGRISFNNSNSKLITERYFSCNCGIGFDAQVAYLANKNTLLRGLPLYLLSVFKTMRLYKSSRYFGNFNNYKLDGKKLLIAIGNGVTSGGGFRLNPHAENDDGLLNFCIAKDMSRVDILKVLPKAITGSHLTSEFIEYGTFTNAKFSVKEPVFIHIDGEVISTSAENFEFTVIPKSLKTIVRE